MGLSCPQMLLGSLPVVLVIAPSTALGACLTQENRPGWDMLAKMTTLLALGSQLGVSIGFAAVIEHAASVHAAKIAQLPLDEEAAATQPQARPNPQAVSTPRRASLPS